MSVSLFFVVAVLVFLNRDSWELIAVLEVFPHLNLTELAKCLLRCQNCGITSQKKSLSEYSIIFLFETDTESSRCTDKGLQQFLPALFGTSQGSAKRNGVLCPSIFAGITRLLFPVHVKHLLHSAMALLTLWLLCVMMLSCMTCTCLYKICVTCWVQVKKKAVTSFSHWWWFGF